MNNFKIKDFVINVIPLVLWLAFFFVRLYCVDFGWLNVTVNAVLIFGVTLFLSIYNTLHSSDAITILYKNIISTVSNLLGMVLEQQLSHHFIQADYEANPVMKLFIVALIVFSTILTLIGCATKTAKNKK